MAVDSILDRPSFSFRPHRPRGGVGRRGVLRPVSKLAQCQNRIRRHGNGTTDDTAAIQAALDAVLANQLSNKGGVVVYLPAGTYRITNTLFAPRQDSGNPNRLSYTNAMVVGEDPSTTTIRWDGPADGTMMWINGVNGFQVGRITWNGNNTAKICVRHEWLNYGSYSTNNQHFDEVFKNSKYGLYVTDVNVDHQGDAEAAVYRCKFFSCSESGVRIDSGNAYDWWFWYCRFENCKFGITNTIGNFCVYGSIFKNSTQSDLKVGGARYFAARDNFSSNSASFLSIRPLGPLNASGGNWVLQGNRIIDPAQTDVIQIAGSGASSLLMYDNVIASKSGVSEGPVIRKVYVKDSTLLQKVYAFGNTFTASNPFHDLSQMIVQFDNVQVARSSISTTEPTLPETPPRVARQVFEVPHVMWWDANLGTPALQNTINSAAAYAAANPGSRPVVHLPSISTAPDGVGRTWSIKSPIVVPAGVEMTILGDAQSSVIRAYLPDGLPSGQPRLLLRGPSRVTVKDIKFSVGEGSNTTAILVDNCDQVGARIYMQSAMPNGTDADVLVDGLSHARVNMHNIQATRFRIVGGSSAGAARTAIFGGASSDAGSRMFDVRSGGSLLARDFWYESNTTAEIMRCSGSGVQPGNVAIECAYIYNNGQDIPTNFIDGYNGTVTMASAAFGGKTKFVNNVSQLRFLKLGGYSGQLDPGSSVGAQYLISDDSGSEGRQNRAFIRNSLSFQRTVKPEFISALAPGLTDVRLIGLQAAYSGAQRGIVLIPGIW